ncbi:MAG TPA: PASTA domain-containing protein [bacterium]|nr:PASTA domain-containing protein [bacterium]
MRQSVLQGSLMKLVVISLGVMLIGCPPPLGPINGPGDPTIEFTHVPKIGSAEDLEGQVWHVTAADHGVAVYIKVGVGWWTKPYWDQPVSLIYPDGSWRCDITTGGYDQQATEIIAFLIESDYDPPLAQNIQSLPEEIFNQALNWVKVNREQKPPATVVVPNVVDLTESEARQLIEAAELAVGQVSTEYHETASVNQVISQSPQAGVELEINSQVNLTVSLGSKPPATVVVPNVVDLTESEARQLIEAAELAVGQVSTEYHETASVNQVISQSPQAGVELEINSQVNLTVSLGSKPPAYQVYGLNFGPYTKEGQNPEHGTVIPKEQIRELLEIIAPYTQWVRTFGTTHGLEHVGPIANELGLKVAVGAWLDSNSETNQEQIDGMIEIANAGYADLLIVGSETLLRGDLSASELIGYINQVKSLAPGLPVTTADIYGNLLNEPEVIEAVDIVLVNYYPVWEGISIDYAVAHLHQQHQMMQEVAGDKQVIVSETGWPSQGEPLGQAVPSKENAAFYFLNFVSWARAEKVDYFYFAAFNEPWKQEWDWGPYWGVWDQFGQMKPGMEAVFEDMTILDNWSGQEIIGGCGDPVIEFTFVPDCGSYDDLVGQVWHVAAADHGVAVYIKVGVGWWTKPYWDQPVSLIYPDGSWRCDITTGGYDQQATEIIAFLIESDYDPPLANGDQNLPAELEQNALVWVEVKRDPDS